MPRKLVEPTVQIKALIPESLFARVQIETFDIHRGRTSYGKLSALITRLLREHFGLTQKGENINVRATSVDWMSMGATCPQENQAGSPSTSPEDSASLEQLPNCGGQV